MIGILTKDFSLYHDLIQSLQKRQVPFASLSFDEPIPHDIEVIMTSPQEKRGITFEKTIPCPPGSDIDTFIDKALNLAHTGPFKLMIGIDPGRTPGIAIFRDGSLLKSLNVSSPDDVYPSVRAIIDDWPSQDVLIRVGHGARLIRNRIVNALQKLHVPIEIVDETSTSYIKTRKSDKAAASLIALTPGTPVKKVFPLHPKKGEIRDLQQRSRNIDGQITISTDLATKVLRGQLQLDDAIQRQRKKCTKGCR